MSNIDIKLVEVNGITYNHGFNEQFEYFAHTDDVGRLWEIWRHRKGPICIKTWFASVTAPGRNGGTRMLNTAIVDGDGNVQQADPLFHLNAFSNPGRDVLLTGLTELVKAGEWPD